MLSLIISGVTFAYLIITSAVVLAKNHRKPLHYTLAVALLSFGVWLIGVAGLTGSWGANIWYGRGIYLAAITGLLFLYLFVYHFVRSVHLMPQQLFGLRPMVGVAVFLLLTAVTPLLLKSVEPIGEGKLPEPAFGPVYPLFALWLLFIAVAITVLLLQARRSSVGRQRSQAQTILLGLGLFVGLGITTNVLLPAILPDRESAKFTPLSAIILASSLSYAVLKHKFLDIRLVVARAVAYSLLLAAMVGLYSLIIFGLVRQVLPVESTFSTQIAPIIVVVLLAFTTPFLKRFFDKLTNRVFYQDAYDPQALMDELNQVLVASIEVKTLLKKATAVVDKYLKSEFCLIGVRETETKPMRIGGTKKAGFTAGDIRKMRELLPQTGQKLIITDELGNGDAQIKHVLDNNDIAIFIRLTETEDLTKPAAASLILGPKKSGNVYNRQDVRTICIIADQLLIAIQNALRFEEIQGFADTLQARVDEATAKLQDTNRKLRALDETKDEFISMASHQLRTPLTSIKGYVSMVNDEDFGRLNTTQHEMLAQAFASAQRMVYLISDLLNVSRLKAGKFVIEARPVNLAKMVADEIAQLQETARARGLTLAYLNPPKHFPELCLDETKTRQVIMNFVDNAIYYTPSGGHVTVEVVNGRTMAELRVTDNGIGVPVIEQSHLFTKFYRAANARKARPDGTGLGLFMAKKVVLAQGGSLIFESVEGKGSTFGFSFNKRKLAPPPKDEASASPNP